MPSRFLTIVISIDPLDRNRAMPRWPAPDGVWIETRRHMEALIAERGGGRLIVMPCFAEEVFDLVRPPLAALVIDTEHSYEPQVRQIDAWAPLVRDGGVIVFDDFDMEPVASAWRDCEYRRARQWLTCETFESLGIVRVAPQPRPVAQEAEQRICNPEGAGSSLAGPINEVSP